jgi:hypothetical protein
MEVNHVPEGVWPKGQVDGGRPLLLCMEELLPCTLAEVPDGLLRDAILEMGVDPAKGKTLSLGTAAVLESIVRGSSVVTMVVEDADAVLLGEVLERALSFHCFFRGELGHEMDVLEIGVVVDKYGGCSVAFLGECSLELGNEANLR